MKDHRDHDIQFNNIAAEDKRKQLLDTLIPLREVEESLSQSINNVIKAESEIQAQQKEVTHKIESSFKELQKLLELRKQLLLGEVNRNLCDPL